MSLLHLHLQLAQILALPLACAVVMVTCTWFHAELGWTPAGAQLRASPARGRAGGQRMEHRAQPMQRSAIPAPSACTQPCFATNRVCGAAPLGGGGEAEHPAPCSWVCLFPDPPCEMGRDAIQGSSDGRESLREGTGTGAARSLLVLCPRGNTEGCCWESVWVGTWSTTCCFPWKETGEFTARHRRSERAMPGLCRAQQWVPESTGQG